MAEQEFVKFLLFLKRKKLASATMGNHPNDIYNYVDIEGGTVVGVIMQQSLSSDEDEQNKSEEVVDRA